MVFPDIGTSSSMNAWTAWNGNYPLLGSVTSTTSVTTTHADGPVARLWTQWNNSWSLVSTTNATSITINAAVSTWNGWNQNWTPTVRFQNTPLFETVEQRRAREAQQQQCKEIEAVAKAKAEKLLVENLSVAQRDQLKQHGYFDVEVSGKIYRIKRGYAGNVELLDDKRQRSVRRFCIHPSEHVPDGDAMLSQKLLLEANEDEFIRIANKTNLS